MSKAETIRERYIELKKDLDPEIAYFLAAVEWFNKKLNENE